MNWLGKVFIVVIVVMSLVFMGLSMAVYSAHKNWKTLADTTNTQLQAEKARNTQLISEQDRRIEELDRVNTMATQQAAKSEAERVVQADRIVQLQAENESLKQNQREHIALAASTQAINKDLDSQVAELRSKVRDEQQKRDRIFKEALDATEALNKQAGEYNSARERSEQLTKQVAGMTSVMRASGLDPATDPAGVVPTVEGVVSRVERKAGSLLVEVSIGSDDGLKKGNTLEVYRGGKYLGRVDIIETSPDKAVGRVDRNFQQGQIQEGDRVATRIKL